MVQDWQAKADAKRQAILDSIPEKWRLSSVPSAQDQKDVTGPYIQQFLDPKEIEITETDAVGIAKQTASGAWSAVAVAEAFCHRASLAHQLVRTMKISRWVTDASIGQLSARDILRCSSRGRESTRCLPGRAQETEGAPSWRSRLAQGSVPCQERRHQHGIRRLDRYV